MRKKPTETVNIPQDARTKGKKPYERPAICARECIETIAATCTSGGGYKNLGDNPCTAAINS